MKFPFFLLVSLFFFKNIYPINDYLTWKEIKAEYPWSTANVLWCRYKMPSGKMFENAGHTPSGMLMTYEYSAQNKNFFWSCPDVYDPFHNIHSCPHYLTDSRYNYSDSWFIVNDIPHPELRVQFESNALISCLKNTPHENYQFVEYGIKSTADFLSTFFHSPFFARLPDLSPNLPFSRIVVFGDSLTDSGNSFDTLNYPVWPYFMGRFSNGLTWVEYLTQRLIYEENKQFDLYNYAVGGGGVTNPGYNPFGLFHKQVQNYLDVMTEGEKNHILDPGYDATLYIIFIGSNDYTVPVDDLSILGRLLYCAINKPDECAENVVRGIQSEIENIIQTSNGKAKYFIIPTQPDLTIAPYYQKLNGKQIKEKKFLADTLRAHNIYMSKMLDDLESRYPQAQFLRLPIDQLISDMIKNPKSKYTTEAKITNTKQACFTGSAKVVKNQTFCDNPAASMFWDGVHLTTSTNCILGEYSAAQIYEKFGKKLNYKPHYKECYLNDVTHKKP